MIVFDEHQVIALRIDHLPAEIALAEDGIAGDQTPLEDQTLEQSKGGFVLVGLVLRDRWGRPPPPVAGPTGAGGEAGAGCLRPAPAADLPSRE